MKLVKHPRGLLSLFNSLEIKNIRSINTLRPCFFNRSSEIRLCSETEWRNFQFLHSRNDQFNLLVTRNKHHGKKKTRSTQNVEDSSDEEEEDEDDDTYEDGGNVRTHTLKSLRLDLILKTSLKISRRKVEESFYGNKIEVNGKKINKKSQTVNQGDEIIFIKSQDNEVGSPTVFELKILKVKMDPDTDNILVTIMKSKSNNAKNYRDQVQ